MAIVESFSGIRGIYGKDLTDSVAVKYTYAYCSFLRNKTNTAYQTNQPTQQTSATSIQNDNDLMSASSELDQEDIYGTVDPQLNQNDIDAQTF